MLISSKYTCKKRANPGISTGTDPAYLPHTDSIGLWGGFPQVFCSVLYAGVSHRGARRKKPKKVSAGPKERCAAFRRLR